jgi:hypothetical protein
MAENVTCCGGTVRLVAACSGRGRMWARTGIALKQYRYARMEDR